MSTATLPAPASPLAPLLWNPSCAACSICGLILRIGRGAAHRAAGVLDGMGPAGLSHSFCIPCIRLTYGREFADTVSAPECGAELAEVA